MASWGSQSLGGKVYDAVAYGLGCTGGLHQSHPPWSRLWLHRLGSTLTTLIRCRPAPILVDYLTGRVVSQFMLLQQLMLKQ